MPIEEECVETLRELRWKNGVKCVGCASLNVKKDGVRGLYQIYQCKDCGSYFNDRSGTIFQDTKVPLSRWFLMAFLMQYKTSVLEISKTIGVAYRNAYYMAKKLRESVYASQIVKKLRGTVEMDEVYVTAGLKGKKGRIQEGRL
jgi:transposase-like protein